MCPCQPRRQRSAPPSSETMTDLVLTLDRRRAPADRLSARPIGEGQEPGGTLGREGTGPLRTASEGSRPEGIGDSGRRAWFDVTLLATNEGTFEQNVEENGVDRALPVLRRLTRASILTVAELALGIRDLARRGPSDSGPGAAPGEAEGAPANDSNPASPRRTGDTVTRQHSCGLSPHRHRVLSPDREVVTTRSRSGLSPCHRF
jgi:hypothetical protein